MKSDPPGPGQWLDIVEEIYSMEICSLFLRIKAGTHEQRWGTWTVYKGTDV